MKKLALFTLLTIMVTRAFGQFPATFDISCLSNNAHPGNGWSVYNPIPATIPDGVWRCTATDGRPNGSTPTPSVYCTGFYLGAHHLDTSYLLTPQLDLTSAEYSTGPVYLLFDSKKVNNTTSGRLAMAKTQSDTMFQDSTKYQNVQDSSVTPMFSTVDATQWNTYQINLTDSIDKGPFFFAFRFTSTATASLGWYIDNVRLSAHPLKVGALSKQSLPISIIGYSSSSQIELSYTAYTAGSYNVIVYDMVGRVLYNGQLEARPGTANYTISGLNLHSGIYCIKMGNENAYGTTKLIIP